MSIQTPPNSTLRFDTRSDLERYRVDSLFEKEPETIAWIESWRPSKSRVFYDVGANIGIFSLYAPQIHSDLEVFAFEPEVRNFIALSQNCLINSTLSVTPLNVALSDSAGLSSFAVTDQRIGNSNSQLCSGALFDTTGTQPERVDSVLSFCVDYLISDLKFPLPEFVKIDVDGHEDLILAGMRTVLESEALTSLLVEFNHVDQLDHWTRVLKESNLIIDTQFDSLPNHSRFRRMTTGSSAMNVIFSRQD